MTVCPKNQPSTVTQETFSEKKKKILSLKKKKSIKTSISYQFSRSSPTSSYKCITLTHAAWVHVRRGSFCFQPQRKNAVSLSAPVVTPRCAALLWLSSVRAPRPIKRTACRAQCMEYAIGSAAKQRASCCWKVCMWGRLAGTGVCVCVCELQMSRVAVPPSWCEPRKIWGSF